MLKCTSLKLVPLNLIRMTDIPANQRNGAKRVKKFMIPFNQENPSKCSGSHVKAYMNALDQSIGPIMSIV